MTTIFRGQTDVSVRFRIIDSTDGSPETGVTAATGGLALRYHRNGGSVTAPSLSTLGTVDAAHSDGGLIHLGDGYYRWDVPDAAFAAGARSVLITGTATGMIVIGQEIELVDPPAPLRNVALGNIPFKMVDETDGYTPETGLSVTAQVHRDDEVGYSAAAGTVTETGNGTYRFDATAGDMDGNVVTFRFTAVGARDAEVAIATLEI